MSQTPRDKDNLFLRHSLVIPSFIPFYPTLSDADALFFPDASGWCWYIPLHNGTTSVGVVQN